MVADAVFDAVLLSFFLRGFNLTYHGFASGLDHFAARLLEIINKIQTSGFNPFVMCLIDLLFLSLALGIFECLRTVAFDAVLLDVVVAVLAVDTVIHIGLDLAFDLLLLGSLHIGAVVLLGGFDQWFDDADANSFLEIGKEILFGILRFLGDNGVDYGIKFVIDIAIHFVSEQVLGFADDLLIRNGHFAVLIEIKFIGGSCLDSEVFFRSLVWFQLL